MRGGRPSIIFALAGASVLPSCGDRQLDEPPQLLEHRVESSTRLCDVMLHPECGIPETDWDFEQCMVTFASAEGNGSYLWGYNEATGEDGCIEEWHSHVSCILSLSCDEQRRVLTDGAFEPGMWEERPCLAETRDMLDCAHGRDSDSIGGPARGRAGRATATDRPSWFSIAPSRQR